MPDFITNIFSDSGFMPHGHCYYWRSDIIWLHVIANGIIALAYYSIPFQLFYFISKKKENIYHWVFVLFGIFILACGTTHVMDIITIWKPVYRIDGILKLFTGLVSILTSIMLIRLMPKALAIPSRESLDKMNRQLETANEELKAEIHRRNKAETDLQSLNKNLEELVMQRTQEVMRINESLKQEITRREITETELQKAHDLMELRVNERTSQLNDSNNKLSNINEELEQFAYVTSHDLKEPIRMISIYTQLLNRSMATELKPEVNDYLKFINEGIDRIQLLINDLLEYGKVGRANVPLKDVEMDKVVKNTISNLQMMIAERGVVIQYGHLPAVKGFAPLLISLMQNLIENAIKFSDNGNPQIEIGCRPEGDMLCFFVKDNGIGIDSQYRERIFIIFQRLHSRDKYQGTGVGLAICKKIVTIHGGKIWVEPNAYAGSTFYFTLCPA